MNTGCFVEYKMVRLLDIDDSEGPTYAVQYFADTMDDYQKYVTQHAPNFRKASTDKWGDRFIAFRTLMEVVQ
jgi:DNA gyrase inhibitor GyrI